MGPDNTPKNTGKSILLVGSQMETGGSQRNLLSQAVWFQEHGYRVQVIFLYDKEGLHDTWQAQFDLPIINLHARRPGAGPIEAVFRLLYGIINGAFKVIGAQLNPETRFDAIETFTHHPTLFIMPAASVAGIPRRIASHRGRIRDFPSALKRIHTWMVNSRMVTALVAVSEQTRIQSLEEGISPEKIVVIPNGLEIAKKLEANARKTIRLEWCESEAVYLVLSVGRLNYEKGHDQLIEAIPLVLQKKPDTMFLFAGDGLERQRLESRANELGIMEKVQFIGIRSDAVQLMAVCDAFVLPSRSEGMPNALLEAMGAGAAVVSFEVGGVKDIIHHRKNGMLVQPENIHQLAETIVQLFENPQLRSQLGKEAIKTIMHSYSLETMCQNYERLLLGQMQKD